MLKTIDFIGGLKAAGILTGTLRPIMFRVGKKP
jgi:hypothetical protein